MEEVSITLLDRTVKLTVDTLEHEFVSSGDDSMMFLIKLSQWLTCSLILMTNGPMIYFIMKQVSKTFLDWLVVFDCCLCLSNIITLILLTDNSGHDELVLCYYYVFFSFLANLCNKLLTVGIVIYRCTLVLGSSIVRTSYQRKVFENLILLVIFLTSFYLTGWAIYYREDYRHFLGKMDMII